MTRRPLKSDSTAPQAAEFWGVSRQLVGRLIGQGRIATRRMGPIHVISAGTCFPGARESGGKRTGSGRKRIRAAISEPARPGSYATPEFAKTTGIELSRKQFAAEVERAKAAALRKLRADRARRTKLRTSGKSVRHLADVYFLQRGTAGPIKIGSSLSVAKRILAIQVSSAERCELLGVVCGGGAKLEKQLHRKFSACRLSGEWFSPTDELMAEIIRLAADNRKPKPAKAL
jgi:Meiotically up-regulated gene 113